MRAAHGGHCCNPLYCSRHRHRCCGGENESRLDLLVVIVIWWIDSFEGKVELVSRLVLCLGKGEECCEMSLGGGCEMI